MTHTRVLNERQMSVANSLGVGAAVKDHGRLEARAASRNGVPRSAGCSKKLLAVKCCREFFKAWRK